MNPKELIPNDKLTVNTDDLIGIILTATAAILCVAIDTILKEENDP